jgi:hypothetical protein
VRFGHQIHHLRSQLVAYKWSAHVQPSMRRFENALSAFSAHLEAVGATKPSTFLRDSARLQHAGEGVGTALGIHAG